MTFPDRLREARKNKGLTQEQLGRMIGVAKSTITGYEKGKSDPDVDKLSKIIQALEIDANYLWQDTIKNPLPTAPSGGLHDQLDAMIDALSQDEAKAILEFVEFLLWKREQRQHPSEDK